MQASAPLTAVVFWAPCLGHFATSESCEGKLKFQKTEEERRGRFWGWIHWGLGVFCGLALLKSSQDQRLIEILTLRLVATCTLLCASTWKEEAARAELFKLVDINHNGMVSLAEIDKARTRFRDSGPVPALQSRNFRSLPLHSREALPEVMGCTALFNAAQLSRNGKL